MFNLNHVTFALIAAGVVMVGSAYAAETMITQKGKNFSIKKLDLNSGDTIKFINNDNVAHNVYTIMNGEKKDLGLQKPGEEGEITFDAAGRHRIRCAIHPRMKMVVTVK